MHVEMLTTAAGPQGAWLKGERVTLTDDLAAEFIAAGAAREVAEPELQAAAAGDEPADAAEPRTAEAPSPGKPKPPRKARARAASGAE